MMKAEARAVITAWSPNGAPNIDYRMAVLGVLQMTWLRLSAYSELLRRQVVAEGGEADEAGEYRQDTRSSGLIGHKYSSAGEGAIYAASEEVRALVALEASERAAVVRYAKVAHDMGISDRLTNLAERWGDVVAGRIALVLDALDLTPEQQARVPGLLGAHLGTIDVEAIGGPAAIEPPQRSGARGVRDGGGRS